MKSVIFALAVVVDLFVLAGCGTTFQGALVGHCWNFIEEWKEEVMRLIVVIISGLVLSSCMHLGLMRSGAQLQSGSELMLEKEVTAGDVRAIAIFPPMRLGKESILTLRLVDRRTGLSISGAQVTFHAEYMHEITDPLTADHHQMHEDADSTGMRRIEQVHDNNFEEDVAESSIAGTYTMRFAPSQSGAHRLMFHIRSLADWKMNPDIVVEATRTVSEKMSGHEDVLHGLGGTSTYVIIGVVIMGGMIVAMWAIGARMF